MQDRETGSWWQQVSGMAITGPLKGKKLESVFHDELTFETWKQENRGGRVLKPDEQVLKANRYAPKEWEARIARLPVVGRAKGALPARTLILGVQLGSFSKAYPVHHFKAGVPLNDVIAGSPLVIFTSNDGKSIRVFKAEIDGRKLVFFASTVGNTAHFIDEQTATQWDFTGTATKGPLKGKMLQQIPALKDFYFDWKNYHPDTLLYTQPLI